MSTFGGEDWRDEFPDEPEPGCFAGCFADCCPTDEESRISTLQHAYYSVTANEGIYIYQLLVMFGMGLCALSVWLILHIISTKQFVLIIPVILTSLVTIYCCGYICLKYRLRKLSFELVATPFKPIVRAIFKVFKLLVKPVAAVLPTVPKCFVFRKPRYSSRNDESNSADRRLCHACDGIVSQSRLLTGSSKLFHISRAVEHWQHHSFRGLEQCANTCHFCSLLLKSISIPAAGKNGATIARSARAGPNSAVSSEALITKLWEAECHSPTAPQLKMKMWGDSFKSAIPLVIEEVRGFPTSTYNCPLSTNSKSTWRFAKDFIFGCLEHDLCRNDFLRKKGAFVPTRVLEITGSQSPTVKLVETERGFVNDSPYVVLSHCWGGVTNIPRLLRGNMDAFKESIPFSNLPKNFRDAVIITAKIGFKYLWIDSLCIIQDDDDWKSQAPQMGLIYAHASFAISAAASANPFGGCFCPEDPFEGDCPLRRDGDSTLVVRTPFGGADGIEELFVSRVDSQYLNQRGWTFQERLLSKRVLHFCDGVVLFECNTLRASKHHSEGVLYDKRPSIRADGARGFREIKPRGRKYRYKSHKKLIDARTGAYKWETLVLMGPSVEEQLEDLRSTSASRGIRGAFQVMLRTEKPGSSWLDKLELHESWLELVEQYSMRNLTRPDDDRLMALVGIASFIENSDRKFVGGLWKQLLPLNLLWFRVDSQTNEPPARPARNLPTWSWASVDGRVSHRLRVESSRGRQGPQRPEVSERMLARNAFKSATWEHVNPLIGTEVEMRDVEKINDMVHNATLKLQHFYPLVDLGRNSREIEILYDIQFDPSTTLYGLATLELSYAQLKPSNSARQLHGIVIVKPTGQDLYERVGYFWTANERTIMDILRLREDSNYIWLR